MQEREGGAALAPGQARMEKADVEAPRQRVWIEGHQVLRDGTMRETAPMDGHAESLQVDRFALVSAKDVDAFDFRQLFRDLALRVVVALYRENQDAGAPQP